MNRIFKHIFLLITGFIFFTTGKAQDTAVLEEPPAVEMPSDTLAYSPGISLQRATGNFNEAGTVEKTDVRKIPDNEVNLIKSDEAYWYVNEAPERKKPEMENRRKTLFDAQWFKTLFWIVLTGGFIALIVWFLATSNIRLLRKPSKPVAYEEGGEELTENIFEINFEKEIQKAIAGKEYRMAVRLMYLQTLRDLSLHNLISYTHEKTNSDYLFQLAGTSYYTMFFRITRNFNYTWYGHFEVSEDSFSAIKKDFTDFKNQIS